jgi:hypothetical protein
MTEWRSTDEKQTWVVRVISLDGRACFAVDYLGTCWSGDPKGRLRLTTPAQVEALMASKPGNWTFADLEEVAA